MGLMSDMRKDSKGAWWPIATIVLGVLLIKTWGGGSLERKVEPSKTEQTAPALLDTPKNDQTTQDPQPTLPDRLEIDRCFLWGDGCLGYVLPAKEKVYLRVVGAESKTRKGKEIIVYRTIDGRYFERQKNRAVEYRE